MYYISEPISKVSVPDDKEAWAAWDSKLNNANMKMIKLAKLTVLSALLAFAGACYNYSPVPEALNENQTDSFSSRIGHRGFPGDCSVLTLKKAEEIALKNNPDYLSTRHSFKAAKARFYERLSTYMPTLDAYWETTENAYTPTASGGTGAKSISSTNDGGFRARLLVFDGLMRTMDTLAAYAEKREAEELNRDSRRLLLETVSLTYNDVILTREKMRIAETDRDFNQKLLDETRAKYEAGTVPLSEVLNFRIRINNAKSALISARYDHAGSKYILSALLGITRGTIPDSVVLPPMKEEKERQLSGIDIYLDSALNNRPDLRSFRHALAAAKYELWSRYGAFFPQFHLNADYGYRRTAPGYDGRYHMRSHSRDRRLNYGASMNWTLFSGGGRIADLWEARALMAREELLLVEKWIEVVSEVRQAYDNYVQAQQQISIFSENLELVKQNRSLVEEEYKAGNTTITRLNEAQRDLVESDTEYIGAMIDLENARAGLEAATGVRN